MVNARHLTFGVGGALTIAYPPAFLVSLGFSGVAAVAVGLAAVVGSRLTLFARNSESLCRDHGYPEDADRRGGQRKLIGGPGQ